MQAHGGVGGQQRGGVGADREERDKAEIQEPGQTDLEIEAHAHQNIEADQHQHLADVGAGNGRQQPKRQEREAGSDEALAAGVGHLPSCGAPLREEG